jgi:hypothetical protein
MNPIHTGIIRQGKEIFDSPNRYLVHKAKMEGKRFELVLKLQKSQRSLQYNRYYFGVIVEILAESIGYDRESMHENLKLKFASLPDPNHDGMFIIERTSKMTTERFMRYCADIQQWAAEFLNIYLPDPNEIPLDNLTYEVYR